MTEHIINDILMIQVWYLEKAKNSIVFYKAVDIYRSINDECTSAPAKQILVSI